MSHQEKKIIFDQYAKSQGFESWLRLKIHFNNRSEDYDEHIFAACDLVQEEQQRCIAENARTEVVFMHYGPACAVDKASIINPENKIQ